MSVSLSFSIQVAHHSRSSPTQQVSTRHWYWAHLCLA